MTNGWATKEKLEELGYTDEDFMTDNLLAQAEKFKENQKNPVPQRKIMAYPTQETRKGRPYFYLQWFERDENGKRKHHKKYLGKSLPSDYRIGKSVELSRHIR